jgi:hypothetical protein
MQVLPPPSLCPTSQCQGTTSPGQGQAAMTAAGSPPAVMPQHSPPQLPEPVLGPAQPVGSGDRV